MAEQLEIVDEIVNELNTEELYRPALPGWNPSEQEINEVFRRLMTNELSPADVVADHLRYRCIEN